jgi:hypothetical protein
MLTTIGTIFGLVVLAQVFRLWKRMQCRRRRDAMKSPRCPLCDHETLIDEEGREVADEFVVGDYECPECGYTPSWRNREEVGDLVAAIEKLDGVRIQFGDILYRASLWTPDRKQSSGLMRADSSGQSHDEERLLTDAWGDIKRAQNEYPEAFEVPVEGAPSAALVIEKFEHADPDHSSAKMLVEKVLSTTDFRRRALQTKAVFDCIREGIAEAIRRRVDEGEADSRTDVPADGGLEEVELPEAPVADVPILGALERAVRR